MIVDIRESKIIAANKQLQKECNQLLLALTNTNSHLKTAVDIIKKLRAELEKYIPDIEIDQICKK